MNNQPFFAGLLERPDRNELDFEKLGKTAFECGEPRVPFLRQKLGNWTDEQRNAFAKGWHGVYVEVITS